MEPNPIKNPAAKPVSKSPNKKVAVATVLAALGVVYGDIGTSPIYALHACFSAESGISPTFENVTGVLSLVFWAITWIVVFKYLSVLMNASNRGEGGIMALVALLTPQRKSFNRRSKGPLGIILLGLFGAALLYGDGIITPAISVLSSVEGLQLAAPSLQPLVVPLTAVILLFLFAIQRHGTQRIGFIFGPIMLVWFLSIAAVALPHLIQNPSILQGLNPTRGLLFLLHNGAKGFLVLTAVVLCITGAEALYADMGHFGAGSIRWAWYTVVYPALIINYFGQGAYLMSHAGATVENPFFAIVPHAFLYPMIIIAMFATIIASQALISGVFSMTQQAISLGFMPRFRIWHTSDEAEGQIYIPYINNFLLVSCIALVIGFRTSDRLAGAYGIAVTGTMLITSLLFYQVSRKTWRWPLWRSLALTGCFVIVDLVMLGPNLTKVLHGGWVPLVAGVAVYALMTTWERGRKIVHEKNIKQSMTNAAFVTKMREERASRTKGTALFVAEEDGHIPRDLLLNYKHNKVVHDTVILLTLLIVHVPETPMTDHAVVHDLGDGLYRIVATFGFKQRPYMRDIIEACSANGLELRSDEISFFLSRDILRPNGKSKLARWRKRLFAFLSLNAQPLMEILGIEPEWVIETGALIEF